MSLKASVIPKKQPLKTARELFSDYSNSSTDFPLDSQIEDSYNSNSHVQSQSDSYYDDSQSNDEHLNICHSSDSVDNYFY